MAATPVGSHPADRLTDEAYWDEYWHLHLTNLPVEVVRRADTMQINAILDVFDAYLTPAPDKVALEVGGAPGQYLAYLYRHFGFRCAVLDFSPHGCAVTRRNFELLDIPADVYERDLLEPEIDIGPFDVVYSLGLIEHFADLEGIVAAHARLVRPGGTLILGAPNLRGVNHVFMKWLCPGRLAEHNTDSMRLERWSAFESSLGLERRFCGYIGGFEPGVFAVLERRTPSRLAVYALARLLVRTFGRHFPRLRRLNHPKLSGYLIGVWRVPGPPARSTADPPRGAGQEHRDRMP